MSEQALFEVAIGTEEGVMRGKVGVTTGPMRLSGLVQTAVALTEALTRRAEQLVVLQNETVSCRPGCGACCRQLVPVSPPEAIFLHEVLAAMPADQQQQTDARFSAIEAGLRDADMLEALLDPPATLEPILPIAQQYFALQQACPFLVDESCSIHQQRPVACRDYSVTTPPARCVDPYNNEVSKVPMPLPLSVPLARAAASATGLKPQLLPITLIPHWCRENQALLTRTWPGPELFQRFVAELQVLYPIDEASA